MAFEEQEMLPIMDGMYLRDALQGEFTDIDMDKRQVQVTFPHDTVDTYKTTFGKDAFRESFLARKPLMCWQHDLRDPIGHAISAQVTPRSNELIGQFSDFDAVPNSKRAFSQIEDKTITDFSFGFRQPKYEPHPRIRGVRNIKEAVMMEFSPVSIGSIPGAVATGLREEEFMSQHTAADIAALVAAHVIEPEEGKRMLAEIEGFRDHITILSPEQKELVSLREELTLLKAGETATTTVITKPAAEGAEGGDGGGTDGVTEPEARDDKPGKKTLRIRALEAQLVEAGLEPVDGVSEMRHDGWTPPVIPETVTASDVLNALHPTWQEHLAGVRIAIAAPGEEFRSMDGPDESVIQIAEAIEAAHLSARDWLADVDVRSLPEEAQQALDLFEAAGTSAGALLDVLGVEDRATSTEPAEPTGSEDMAPTEVKCLECGGSGETEDGKTCPECMGSGVVAMTRDDIPDSAPDNAVTCPKCKGKGFGKMVDMVRSASIGKGNMKCPACKGKGWVTKADADDMDKRADTGSWSTKPWSDFTQADYTPAQWKEACLIVDGDGSTKAQCQLPVKEPDGTYNVNGISAAASRIDQVKTDGDSVADAAGALADLYGKMGKDVPPEVAKLSQRSASMECNVCHGTGKNPDGGECPHCHGKGTVTDYDPDEVEAKRQAALQILERRAAKAPATV